MNNTAFRDLVNTRSAGQDGSPSTAKAVSTTGATPRSLGSRTHANIPMTPRTVKGGSIDFARQLADQNASSQPRRKFKSSAAPKGSRLAAEYTDRAQQRNATEEEQDEREARVTALEEQVKLGQLDIKTFEQLRDTITGGDVGATHLVKGLDRKLLERVRRGEDVLSEHEKKEKEKEEGKEAEDQKQKSPSPDAEEELEKLEGTDVVPVQREDVKKKGDMAPPLKPVAGTKRSRNDILAELKASRKAAEEANALGSRFKKVGAKKDEPRFERDSKGREVLVTVDEYGRTKRKVRKLDPSAEKANGNLMMPDKATAPLGMQVPEAAPPPTPEPIDDIFEGVGGDYDPLGADLESSSSDEDADEESQTKKDTRRPTADVDGDHDHDDHDDDHDPETLPNESSAGDPSDPTMPPPPTPPKKQIDYFGNTKTEPEPHQPNLNLNDPAILETLKRAAALQARKEASTAAEAQEKPELSSAAQRLFQRDRDLDDMDMGFGGSRVGDGEDGEGGDGRVKLSEWKGVGGVDGDDDDDGGEGKGGKGGSKRKRGGKKKMGDKNSAADVLRVMEERKK